MIRLHNRTSRSVRVHLADRFGDYTETLIEIAPYSSYAPDGCPSVAPLACTIQAIGKRTNKPVKAKKKKHKHT